MNQQPQAVPAGELLNTSENVARLMKGVVVAGGSLSATELELDTTIKGQAVAYKPRKEFYNLPLQHLTPVNTTQGNHTSLVRANLLGGGLTDKLLTVNEKGEVTTVPIQDVSSVYLKGAKELFLADNDHMTTLLNGRGLPEDVLHDLFDKHVPLGTVYLAEGTPLFTVLPL